MNLIDKNKYVEFNNVLSGCRTILDAYYFGEKYNKLNPEMKSIVSSMINGKRYDQVLDMRTMMSVIELLDRVQYKDEAEEIVERYTKKTTDVVQLKALKKLIKNKLIRPTNKLKNYDIQNYIGIIENMENIDIITKPCPHCSHECESFINSNYVICGCTDFHKGWDWVGCKKDWCFSCGKMLCKSWEPNQLYVELNRYHDNECCRTHAKNNNKKYPDDYCQCHNKYVVRDSKPNDIFDISIIEKCYILE